MSRNNLEILPEKYATNLYLVVIMGHVTDVINLIIFSFFVLKSLHLFVNIFKHLVLPMIYNNISKLINWGCSYH